MIRAGGVIRLDDCVAATGTKIGRRYFGTGRYNMPGAMMTKAGKRRQMQIDTNRASPRRGKRR